MDKSEAQALLTQHLALYRKYSYGNLLKLMGDTLVVAVRGPSGTEYQIEIDIVWDSPRDKINILVIGAIDDGRLLQAFKPLCDSFILAPDGKLIGE